MSVYEAKHTLSMNVCAARRLLNMIVYAAKHFLRMNMCAAQRLPGTLMYAIWHLLSMNVYAMKRRMFKLIALKERLYGHIKFRPVTYYRRTFPVCPGFGAGWLPLRHSRRRAHGAAQTHCAAI